MEVRDAVEADGETLADLTGSPRDVMVNLVHDRTVRVAYESDSSGESGDGSEDSEIRGFVSFDVRDETVHVTQLEGDADACDRLLDEPIGFADREGMTVELLVPESEMGTREAAEAAGFDHAGSGPTFEGQPTIRYRIDPQSSY